MAKKGKLNYAVAENVAAIAMEMASHRETFERAYEAAGKNMGGFPGFYQIAIDAAIALEEAAEARKVVWGEDADWIRTTENLANMIMGFMAVRGAPNPQDLVDLAKDSIVRF